MEASYVFRVTFRLSPEAVDLEPRRFETVMRAPAADPGADAEDVTDAAVDWEFFQRVLWRGEANAPDHLREWASEHLGLEVESVSFSELAMDGAYREALRAEVATDLERFRADDVDEVLHKYLGSSVRVTD